MIEFYKKTGVKLMTHFNHFKNKMQYFSLKKETQLKSNQKIQKIIILQKPLNK